VHAATTTISARSAREKMWLIYLEAGVALVLLVLIVWWTWPKNK
jgi:t-SNARE complex subunit (syntaxin)